jgi:hypothetical protein
MEPVHTPGGPRHTETAAGALFAPRRTRAERFAAGEVKKGGEVSSLTAVLAMAMAGWTTGARCHPRRWKEEGKKAG